MSPVHITDEMSKAERLFVVRAHVLSVFVSQDRNMQRLYLNLNLYNALPAYRCICMQFR